MTTATAQPQLDPIAPHPCGVCGTPHNKQHCPSCGAHPWEGYDAREFWPESKEDGCDCSSWNTERDSIHFTG